MDRRRFMQAMAAATAMAPGLDALARELQPAPQHSAQGTAVRVSPSLTEGHTLVCSFLRGAVLWKVYEDLREKDGPITLCSAKGYAYVLAKSAEPAFQDEGPQHLGLDMKAIGLSGPDLLADRLLAHGDPEEEAVRCAAPPIRSGAPVDASYKTSWENFVGTSECSDTTAVYAGGYTRTYHPVQYFPELTAERAGKRHEGLLGGWMPAVRKRMPGEGSSHYELLVFGDVLAKDRFIVQTWHRTTHWESGKAVRVEYGHSYPAYTRRRQPPSAQDFFMALLHFAEYWEAKMQTMASLVLPDTSWTNMARYAFVKEQLVRPGGVYPKYGAIDRDYLSPEYDGFQDTFTMSFYANLEWGRFDLARRIFDNYFLEFVDAEGMINMRGAETGQYGLTLSLVARYFRYTRDASLLLTHRKKIEAMASILVELHDESLQRSKHDRGYGLIHGWCESDSCLGADPSIWWKPYFSNSAFAVRGWGDLAQTWKTLRLAGSVPLIDEWELRRDALRQTLAASISANTQRESRPPYIGPLPGTTVHFRESLASGERSEQEWAHRCYAELLQADVLSDADTGAIIDCMRGYGGTTIGVVANVEKANPESRSILGFISYGYAQALLRLDRIEEYLLFLYAHRYHAHTRGSWTAAEVAGVTGGDALFCIPAQQTIPLLLRWMLVFEDSDASRLHFGRAIPRKWVGSGQPIGIEAAPTRWGRVSFNLTASPTGLLTALVTLPQQGALPEEVRVRFRRPEGQPAGSVSVNGVASAFASDGETVVIVTRGQRRLEVICKQNET